MNFEAYLSRLRALPLVRCVAICSYPNLLFDGALIVLAKDGRYTFPVAILGAPCNRADAQLWARHAAIEAGLMLLVPSVNESVCTQLTLDGVNFLDLAGNYALHLKSGTVSSRSIVAER